MVSRSISTLALACLCTTLGCGNVTGGDEGSDPFSTTGAETGAGPTGTTAPQSTTASSTDAGGSTSSDTTPPGDSSTTTTTGEDGDPSSSADSGPLCPPAPPAGNECLECAHANCCIAWQQCMEDEPCACVVDCHVLQGNSLGMCSNTCNLDSNLYQNLYFCGERNCLGSCDWDCC